MSRSGKAGREEGESERLDALAAMGPFLGHGLTFAMAVGFFFFVGWRVDRWLGSTPVFAILGAFVGAGGGFYHIVRQVSRATPPADRDARGE
jgi:F0F1-type ATP synthase assembly protein I